jgi:hypothetical protein
MPLQKPNPFFKIDQAFQYANSLYNPALITAYEKEQNYEYHVFKSYFEFEKHLNQLPQVERRYHLVQSNSSYYRKFYYDIELTTSQYIISKTMPKFEIKYFTDALNFIIDQTKAKLQLLNNNIPITHHIATNHRQLPNGEYKFSSRVVFDVVAHYEAPLTIIEHLFPPR